MLAIRNIEISKKEISVHRSGLVGHYWHFPENCPLIKVFNRVCWTRTFVMFSSKWNQKASQKRNRFFGWFIIWICHLPVMRHEQVCGASLFSPAPPHRSPCRISDHYLLLLRFSLLSVFFWKALPAHPAGETRHTEPLLLYFLSLSFI